MPTKRLRHRILETEDLTAAIDLGAQEWPELARSEVARALILKGAESLQYAEAQRDLSVESALSALALLDVHYPSGYLEEIRSGWDRCAQANIRP